jgi:large conductance mechanosensitive channel
MLSEFKQFLNAVITFVTIAAAIFFLVVRPLNALAARRAAGAPTESPTPRPCPECLSEIPIAARRCAHCTSQLAAA